MKRIVTFAIYSLKKNSLIEFLHTFIEKAEKCPVIVLKLISWLTILQETFAEAKRIYHISLKSPITEQIRLVDALRDGIVTGLKAIVNAFLKSENSEEREAARLLWTGLSSLKHNNNDQYVEQTGQVDNVLYFLTVTEAASVEILNLGAIVQQLKTANDRMHDLIENRVTEIQDRELGAFSKARAAVEEAYRQFILSVNAWALLNEDKMDEKDDEDPDSMSMNEFFDWANSYIEFYEHKVLKQPAAAVEEEVEDAEGDDNKPGDNKPGEQEPEGGEDNVPPTDQQPGGGENENQPEPPTEQQPGENEGEHNGENGEGGETNQPTGPNTDAWGDGDEGDGSDV